jgi:hypothetical protein
MIYRSLTYMSHKSGCLEDLVNEQKLSLFLDLLSSNFD